MNCVSELNGFRKIKYVLISLAFGVLFFNNGFVSYAAKNLVIYKYDVTGKIIEADYPDGNVTKYIYDSNGNLKSVKTINNASTEKESTSIIDNKTTENKTEKTTENNTTDNKTEKTTENKTTENKTEKTTENKTTENKTTENKSEKSIENKSGDSNTENSTDNSKDDKTEVGTDKGIENKTGGNTEKITDIKTENSAEKDPDTKTMISNDVENGDNNKSQPDTRSESIGDGSKKTSTKSESDVRLSDELQFYNIIKISRPVVDSLKVINKKGRVYINIAIRKIKKKGNYCEAGYQIRYSTNKKFKKSKTVNVIKAKKGKITKKRIKALKNKTYYVKVRAYTKNRNGKKIYSKYSKTKKIKTH